MTRIQAYGRTRPYLFITKGRRVLRSSYRAVILLVALIITGCTNLSTNSPSSSNKSSAESYTQLGIRYLQAGDTVSAKSSLQRALAVDGDFAPALNGLGLVFQAEREPGLAEDYFRKAVQADPSSAMVQNNFGAFLYSIGRFDEACDALARATEDPFYPQRAQAFENLGLCYRLVGKDGAAEFVLDRSLTLSPDRPVALIEMADLKTEQGNFRQASQLFERFRNLVESGRIEHNAKSLWVGVRLAREQGRASRAATYALLLKNQYPDSNEYKKYMESGR